MQLTNLIVAATALFAGVSIAAPAAEPLEYNVLEKRGTCKSPIVRKEWLVSSSYTTLDDI